MKLISTIKIFKAAFKTKFESIIWIIEKEGIDKKSYMFKLNTKFDRNQ